MVTAPIKCVQAKPPALSRRLQGHVGRRRSRAPPAHGHTATAKSPANPVRRHFAHGPSRIARAVERAWMGSNPKPCSHVASVAGRRVRDHPEISKGARRFQARLSRRITKKLPKINAIEKTSTMRKLPGLDLAQWVLHCGGNLPPLRGLGRRPDQGTPRREALRRTGGRVTGCPRALPTDGNQFRPMRVRRCPQRPALRAARRRRPGRPRRRTPRHPAGT